MVKAEVDGAAGAGESRKSLVIKILIRNPCTLKILQILFAKPAPVKPFREWGGGGYPSQLGISRNGSRLSTLFRAAPPIFSLTHLHRRSFTHTHELRCNPGCLLRRSRVQGGRN